MSWKHCIWLSNKYICFRYALLHSTIALVKKTVKMRKKELQLKRLR